MSGKPFNSQLNAAVALAAFTCFTMQNASFANTRLDVSSGTSDLTSVGAGITSDLTFKAATTYSPTTFTINNGASLTLGTLNDLDATQNLTIQNSIASSSSTLTLSGGSNGVAPSTADLLHVASGGTLTIQNGTGTLGVTLGASGNLNIAGTASISSILTMGANAITKTGSGTLTINGTNSGNGGFTIAGGTVSTNNNTGLGSTNNAVSLGLANSSTNAILQITGSPTGVQQNFTVASGNGTRTITSTNSTAFGSNGVVFTASNTITLNHDLIVSDTAGGNIQFRGVINQSGGTYGVTVDSGNTGYIDLRAANTFGGGVAINGGTVVAGIASAGSVGAITNGPMGTGTVTLGGAGSATAATIGINGLYGLLNNLTVNGGGVRNLTMLSAGSTSSNYSGPITLNGDLTLGAVTTTLTTGADRLRIDSAVSGGNNLIVNNANASLGAVAGSGAVRIGGNNSNWSGNLVVAAGQGSLNANNAISSVNTVGVASGATFNFSAATLSPTIAGLSNATAAGALGGSTGGTVTATVNSSRVLTLGGTGTYAFSGTIIDNPLSTVISPNNKVGLTVALGTASSSQSLLGTNTYSGGTTVQSGILRANNATNSTGSGTVTVGSSDGTQVGTLGGNGTIANGTNAVTINPGSTVTAGIDESTTGKLTTGTQAWMAGGQYRWKIASRTGGAGIAGGWDQLAISSLNLSGLSTGTGGQFIILGKATGPLTLVYGDSFAIATYSATTGTPAADLFSLDVSQLLASTTNNDTSSNYSLSFGSGAISIKYAEAAPEPTTALLAGLSGTVLLGRRRRHLRAAV